VKSALAFLATPALCGRAFAEAVSGSTLPIPPLMEVGEDAGNRLDAIHGTHAFLEGAEARTMGWSQDFLGPTLRLRSGRTARLTVGNRIEHAITSHWHGLHVPGWNDGGPQSLIAPDAVLEQALDIDQPAGSFWYHSHPHGTTGDQVYHGLAGLLLIEDEHLAENALPATYGIDDIPLIIQDKSFSRRGRLRYDDDGMTAMQGFRGDRIAVNGALEPVAQVPSGLVRFRLLNASNSRVYVLSFDDGRAIHQIASDAGLLPAPVRLDRLQLAPAERAEILVDFSDGASSRLISQDVPVQMMGGMMGGRMGGGMMGRSTGSDSPNGTFDILSLTVDESRQAAVSELPREIKGAHIPDLGEPVRRRRFELNMMMGMGMMRGMFGGRPTLGINGRTYDMERIDEQLRMGETEIWEISADMMSHPFHVHGTSFQVLSRNGRPVSFPETGMKDVVWVENRAEILVRFDHPATPEAPYMYHCHILEHEDSGMMGQFTVT
jgi:FtsP/CotA-like multicopper oxidase with cupredoxin domain